MIKKTLFAIFTLVFIYISVELFKYFSYLGLGFSAILLLTIFLFIVISGILSWIIKNRKKISAVMRWLIDALTKTRLYQKIIYKLRSQKPRLFRFLKKRLDKNSPTGIYATIGGMIVAVFFFLFIGVGFDPIFKNPLYLADTRTIHLLRAFIPSNYIPFFVVITDIANTGTILIVVAVASVILLLRRNYRAIQYLVISASSGLFCYWLIKLIAHRPRPQGISYIALPQSYGFPSGHATMAVCLFGFIAYLLFKNFKRAVTKAMIITVFLLLSATIGISRAYLGVQYPSDVLAGWYLGLAILTGSITAYEIRNKFYPLKEVMQKSTYLVMAISIALVAIPTASIYQNYSNTKIFKPKDQMIPVSMEDFLKTAPKYSENLLGAMTEPISFIVIGGRQDIIDIFDKAGWHQAGQSTLINVLKEVSAVAKNIDYPTGPMTPAFYNEKANDLGFEEAVSGNATAKQRHHTRYWQTDYWVDGKSLWVATASLDKGVEIGSAIKLPTHKIDPDIDSEREYIFRNLFATGKIGNYQKIDLAGPISGINASGDKFFTDGNAYIIELK